MRRGWIAIAAVATMVAAAACASSGSGGGGGTPTATTPPSSPTPTPPSVTQRVPAAGAAGVSLNATLSVAFDHDMDPATLTSETFFARSAGGAIGGTVSYDAPSLTAQLTPASTLPPSTLITMTLTSAVADSEAVHLAGTVTWTFTTGSVPDTTPPTFAGITSATDNGDGTATLSWLAATDDHTPSGSIVYRAYASTNLTTVFTQVAGATNVVSPPIPAGSYSWTVRAFDAAGNHDLNTATGSATTTVPAVSFGSTIQPIFTANCAVPACHDAATHQQGLELSSGVAYAHLVGVASTEKATLKLVAPSDAARSYLYLKVTNAPGIAGVRMPKNANALPATDIAHLREWILDGAPND